MLSKILAGVLAAAVLTVGGYAYWQYASDGSTRCSHQTGENPPCPSQSTVLPCCQEPSRSAATVVPCCCEDTDSEASPEVLAIAPRELK